MAAKGAAMVRLLCAVAVSSNALAYHPSKEQHQQQQRQQLSRHHGVSHCQGGSLGSVGQSTTSTVRDGVRRRTTSARLASSSMLQSSGTVLYDELLPPHYSLMKIPERGQDHGHAIFGVLQGDGMIESYEIWQKNHLHRPADDDNKIDDMDDDDDDDDGDNNVVVALVAFGDRVNGHMGLVHGGILSLIVDDLCGFAFEALGVPHAVTANLTINYRAPVPAKTHVKVAVQLERSEGRKLYWTAQMTSLDSELVFVEATSLFIIPRAGSLNERINK